MTVVEQLEAARQSYSRHEHGHAAHHYRQVIEADPANGEARHALGVLAFERGKLDEAVAHFLEALALEPENALFANHLGAAYGAQGDAERAIEALRRAIALDPQQAEIYFNLGSALKLEQDLAGAEENFRKALEIKPDYAEAAFNVGNLLRDAGKLIEAKEYLGKAVEARPGYFTARNNLGNVLKSLGELATAEAQFQAALKTNPRYAAGWNNYGILLRQQGQAERSIEAFERALSIEPTFAEGLLNLAISYRGLRRLKEAQEKLQAAIGLRPHYAEAYYTLGIVQKERFQFDEAVQSYKRAIEIRANYPEAWMGLGDALQSQKKFREAVEAFRQAASLDSSSATALRAKGAAHANSKEFKEAGECFQEVTRLLPKDADGHLELAENYRQQKMFAEAMECASVAAALAPGSFRPYNILGLIHHDASDPQAARVEFQRAIDLDPSHAEVHINLGVACCSLSLHDEAVRCFERALRISPASPVPNLNRALTRLLRGDFARGWLDYAWRWHSEGMKPRKFPQPAWAGQNLDGKTILIYAEQGLGDTLQFARYGSVLQALGAKVVLECQKPLRTLLSRCTGINTLVRRGSKLPDFDYHAALLDLPGILKTDLESIPAHVPYIQPDPKLVRHWHERLPRTEKLRVGIAWQGNKSFRNDRFRSPSLSYFRALAEIENIELVSLQKGEGSEQLAELAGAFPVTSLGEQVDGDAGPFMDTSAIMQNLDLVVASDSAIVHLAGAMGVPVWVPLCSSADWRWLERREDSPWYPSMRLFRQPSLGNWEAVFQQMAEQLSDLAGGDSSRLLPKRQAPGISLPAPAGELIDKITILQIKQREFKDPAKLRNVAFELRELLAVKERTLPASPLLARLTVDLLAANQQLWKIEDAIRDSERAKDFGPRFIELARSVYIINDERAKLKRKITELVGSAMIEEKSYQQYIS